jgi:predicted metalloprotease with PDZ domain
VHENIPIVPGSKEMVLLYPEWLPGDHEPGGPIERLGGIVTAVDGKRTQWVRDRVNVYAFHIPLIAGQKTVSLDFDYLSPIKPADGRIEISDAIADIEWNEIVMYPAGYFSRDIQVDARLELPPSWKYATALETASHTKDTVKFERTPLNTLVDSPLYAGLYSERVDLTPAPTDPVHLNLFADKADDLKMTPEELELHKKLAVEADKLYGSHHYKHYDFRVKTVPRPTTSQTGPTAWKAVICWRTSTPTPGMESSAAPPICGRPTSTSPCATISYGCTKA